MANQPPVGSLFAAFLGENPIQHLVGTDALRSVSAANQATLTGQEFFPDLISGPFHDGLVIVFGMATVMSIIGAVASLARGTRYVHVDTPVDGSAAPVRPGNGAASCLRPFADAMVTR